MRSKILVSLWFLLTLSIQAKADLRSYLDPGEDGIYSLSRVALAEKTRFLLQLSEIPQKLAARFGTNESKVLYFELDSNRKSLYLIESPEGRWISSFATPKNIYAKFDVKSVDDETVAFDMLSGLRSISMEDYYSTSDESAPNIRSFEKRVSCSQHMLSQATIESNDVLVFDHTTTCEVDSRSRTVYPLALRYFLRLYQPSADFVPKESSRHKEVGYFETPSFAEPKSGRTVTYAHRWNISGNKKITFAISANTPKEFRTAIRQGILYWNNYMPGKPIKVVQLKEHVPVPNAKYNVVQWDDYSEAHSAYANFRVDPLTGEINGADIYLPSAFAIGSKQRVRKALRLLSTFNLGQDAAPEVVVEQGRRVCNHDHKRSKVCSFNLPQDLATASPAMLDRKVTDETLLFLTREYLAIVVAHEIGHVLGLRHNFAGNLGNEVVPVVQAEMFLKHLESPKDKEEAILESKFSSSVMHYCSFEVDILLGHQILSNKNLKLSYDDKAIEWGYGAQSFVEGEETNAVPFVSDYRVDDYVDVGRYMVYKNPVLDALTKQRELLIKLPNLLVENYIAAKSPLYAGDRLPLREVGLTPRKLAWQAASHTKDILDWCRHSARILALDSEAGVVTSLNEEDLARKKIQWFKEQVNEAGGLSEVLFSLLMSANPKVFKLKATEKEKYRDEKRPHKSMRLFDPEESLSDEEEEEEQPALIEMPDAWPALLQRSFVLLLKEDHMRKFIGDDNVEHEFTEAELKLIEERGKQFFTAFFDYLTEYMLGIFSEAKFELESQVTNSGAPFFDKKIEQKLGILADRIILAESNKVVRGTITWNGYMQNVIVPAIGSKQELRVLAARMISSERGANPAWCARERQEIMRKLETEMIQVLGIPPNRIADEDLSPELLNWFHNHLQILRELSF